MPEKEQKPLLISFDMKPTTDPKENIFNTIILLLRQFRENEFDCAYIDDDIGIRQDAILCDIERQIECLKRWKS